jgi:hypothetical protein
VGKLEACSGQIRGLQGAKMRLNNFIKTGGEEAY